MAVKNVSIDVEVNNLEKLKKFLSESLKLAEELELKLQEIKQSNNEILIDDFVDRLEKAVESLSTI